MGKATKTKRSPGGELDIHPAANKIPGMSAAVFAAMEKDMREKGLLESIKTHKGKIIDGRMRHRICKQLGIKPKIDELDTGFPPEAYSISLNLLRRQLTASQKAMIIAQDVLPGLEEEAKKRQQESGKNHGKGKRKVPKEISGSIHGEARDIAAQRYGVNKKYVSDAKYIDKHNKKLAENVRYGKPDIPTARAMVAADERKKENAKLAKQVELPTNIEIYHGDCLKLSENLAENSTDLIATDPNYGEYALESWDVLGRIAARVLKPGGYCISYSGKMYLSQVISILMKYLEWYWEICVEHEGHAKLFYPRNAIGMHKPILIFCKPPIRKTEKAFPDLIKGSGREKDWHDYQQSEAELHNILNYFVKPGQTILDPFAGGGTTLAVAMDLKCHAIGYELDAENVNAIKVRLAQKMGQEKQAQQ